MKMEIEMENIKDFSVNPVEDEMELLKFRIHELLKTNTVEVNFTKVDGTSRRMVCTLDPSRMPEVEFSENSVERSNDVLSVWDLEKNDWRSFRLGSVNSFMALRSEV